MSGPFPRSWELGSKVDVEDPDRALCDLWDALERAAERGADWEETQPVINPLLDALSDAGYVEQWGHSDFGCIWAITPLGHRRLCELGRDAAEDPK
jgi:hypothetical protein